MDRDSDRSCMPAAATPYDVAAIRADFPILQRRVHGRPLIYLDNAATTQKPQAVIDAEADYYATTNANIHRGVHALSQQATDAYEAARAKVARFINAASTNEIVFVRGTTEAINLVAQCFARPQFAPATRSSSARWSTTRTSCRGSWPAVRRCGAARRAGRRRGRIRSRCVREAAHAAHRLVAVTHVVERDRQRRPGPAGRDARARPEHPGAARRRAGDLAPEDRRCQPRLRLLRVSGHKLFAPTGSGAVRQGTHSNGCRPTRAAAT